MCLGACRPTVEVTSAARRHDTKEIEMNKAIAALAAAATALALVGASSATTPKTLDVVLPKTNSTYVDVGRKGYSPGDYFLATGAVLDKVGGARIGGLAGVWTLVSPAADTTSITLRLPRGTLYVDGRIRHAAKRSVLRVNGGTGAYDGASGTATFRYLSETSGAIHIAFS
jgi:hypothetical protein